MEHPVLTRIRREGFEVLGWFTPGPEDGVDASVKLVVLAGNAGPRMFRRFAAERDIHSASLDGWTRDTLFPVAQDLNARVVFPFDTPPRPFLTWAQKARAGHVSPLGLNIHSTYGLWHAFRAAFLFDVAFDLPASSGGPHPCQTCAAKPCLSACPVSAFDVRAYDVKACARHVLSPQGNLCADKGCVARLACPVGKEYIYAPDQMRFHMKAFIKARAEDKA